MLTIDDFSGDGRSDILLRERGQGPIHLLYATAANGFVAGPTLNWAPDSLIVATGDFNGDGREDFLLTGSSSSGETLLISALQTASAGFQPDWEAAMVLSTGWSVIGAGDFNGDGKTDILLSNIDGRITNGLVGSANATILDVPDAPFIPNVNFNILATSDWHIIGTADFNGDGRADLLWRSDNGTTTNWLANPDGSFSNNWNNFNIVASSDWHIIGTADFNGDGRADLLWQSDDGRTTDWLAKADGGFSNNWDNFNIVASSDWYILGTGDYNGDGRHDLLWRNDAGQITDWIGTSAGGFTDNWSNASTAVDTSWLVQPNPSGAGEWDY